MVVRRQCAFHSPSGEPCRAAPLHDSQFCWVHSPEHAQEAQEARRLGGQRRKREVTLLGAYELEAVNTTSGIQRVLEIATLETLAMENSIPRNRTLGYLMQVELKAMEASDTEERLAALEKAVHGKQIGREPPIFDVEPGLPQSGDKEMK